MSLVDANLQFICIYAGAYGRNSDGGIFSNSNLRERILREALNFPCDQPLSDAEDLGQVPNVMVGNEAFPLHKRIKRTYSGRGIE